MLQRLGSKIGSARRWSRSISIVATMIHEAIESYYRTRGLPHNHVVDEREFRLFLTILRER
jgi:hypothetical protein